MNLQLSQIAGSIYIHVVKVGDIMLMKVSENMLMNVVYVG
jgi:hypothetical protein